VPPIYRPSNADESLRQGEIITDLIQYRIDPETLRDTLSGTGETGVQPIQQPFAVVMTQDCDVIHDYGFRQTGKGPGKRLPNLLFCEMANAQTLFGSDSMSEREWQQVVRNKNERYQFLERVPGEADAATEGLPELTIDFKRYFTLPTDEVYLQLDAGAARRRSVIKSPYLEQLATRFHYFQYRVALPSDHASE